MYGAPVWAFAMDTAASRAQAERVRRHLDTARHTLFHCPAWHCRRQQLEHIIGKSFAPATFQAVLLRGQKEWSAVTDLIHFVLSRKAELERRRP